MSETHWPPQATLVTGAASGIGRQLALLLAQSGVAVAGIDRNETALQSLKLQLQTLTIKSAFAVADVTDAAALTKAVHTLEERVGPIDLLIASAGIGEETSALSLDAALVARIIQVNLIGVANSIAAVLPGMLQRQRGHLVALSSLASLRGLPRMAAYCASKSGVNALMEAIFQEVAPHGIATTTVCPGWVRTPMTENLNVPMPDILEVEDAARRILTAIRHRKKFLAFPARTAWELRLLRLLPAGISDLLVRRKLRRVPTQRTT